MGSNKEGQCGFDKDVGDIIEPKFLLSDKNIISVCCGYDSSYILTSKN